MHVLSTPPAFVLSQNQTLRKKITENPTHRRQRLGRDRNSSAPKACSSFSKLLLRLEILAWLVSLYLVFKEQTPLGAIWQINASEDPCQDKISIRGCGRTFRVRSCHRRETAGNTRERHIKDSCSQGESEPSGARAISALPPSKCSSLEGSEHLARAFPETFDMVSSPGIRGFKGENFPLRSSRGRGQRLPFPDGREKGCYNNPFNGYSLTTFEGSTVTI